MINSAEYSLDRPRRQPPLPIEGLRYIIIKNSYFYPSDHREPQKTDNKNGEPLSIIH